MIDDNFLNYLVGRGFPSKLCSVRRSGSMIEEVMLTEFGSELEQLVIWLERELEPRLAQIEADMLTTSDLP